MQSRMFDSLVVLRVTVWQVHGPCGTGQCHRLPSKLHPRSMGKSVGGQILQKHPPVHNQFNPAWHMTLLPCLKLPTRDCWAFFCGDTGNPKSLIFYMFPLWSNLQSLNTSANRMKEGMGTRPGIIYLIRVELDLDLELSQEKGGILLFSIFPNLFYLILCVRHRVIFFNLYCCHLTAAIKIWTWKAGMLQTVRLLDNLCRISFEQWHLWIMFFVFSLHSYMSTRGARNFVINRMALHKNLFALKFAENHICAFVFESWRRRKNLSACRGKRK